MIKKHNKLKKIASILSVFVALFLIVIKTIAGVMTGSLAILSSLVDNIADVFASIITLVAVKYSNLPPSKTHKYGYGKAEALSALAQACFIAGSGIFIMYEAFQKFIHVEHLTATSVGVLVMIISLVVTICLVLFQKMVYKITKSQAIKADSAHYKTDIVCNIAILISLGLDYIFNFYWIDPLTALLLSVYLLWNAYDLFKDAINVLLDKELDVYTRKRAIKLIMCNEFVKGMHDFRSRDLGNGYIFEFHLELDGNISLNKAHEYTDIIESSLKNKFYNTQVIIHQEPHGINDERLDNKIKKRKKK